MSGDDVLFAADLALPGGRLRVRSGEVVAMPDDARHVAALFGTDAASRGRHRIRLAGRRLDRRSWAGRVRAGLIRVGSGAVAPDVTVWEHLVAIAGRAGARERLAAVPLLADRGGDPAGVLSGGERAMLDWLVAEALEPRVVVLDRAATGLDPVSLAWAHERLDRWLDGGVGALLRVGRDDEARWLEVRADGAPRPADRPRGPSPGS